MWQRLVPSTTRSGAQITTAVKHLSREGGVNKEAPPGSRLELHTPWTRTGISAPNTVSQPEHRCPSNTFVGQQPRRHTSGTCSPAHPPADLEPHEGLTVQELHPAKSIPTRGPQIPGPKAVRHKLFPSRKAVRKTIPGHTHVLRFRSSIQVQWR